LELALSDEVLDLVGGGFDLAIRAGRLKDSRLVAKRLASRTRVLCAAPSYLASAPPIADLADLAAHACLRGTTETWTFTRNGREQTFKPRGRWRGNSGAAVLDAAIRGLGVCQLPDFYLGQALAEGRLVRLLPQLQPEDEGVWALYPNRRHLSAKVRLVLEHLGAHLAANQEQAPAPTSPPG
jgi:DNA-binding transcriptional LysR family regulator